MKIRTILLTGGLVLLGACSESKYDLDQLVPEEYHKILYVNNSGKPDLTCLLYTSPSPRDTR